jgi:uncharacterized protein YhaN
MIIQEIHIDNFGIFNGYSLKNLKKGLNIIQGNNEAGKSTLLAFIRYTFFGYPDLRSNVNPYFPQSSTKRGGRIKALSSANQKVIFERLEGSKGGVINLTYLGKSLQDPSLWFELLGNATADLYHNIFSFSLDELISLDSLSSSGVEDKIFSISLGLGTISIGDIESNLQTRIDQIYKQRSAKTKIAEGLKLINEQKARIREIRNLLPAYNQLHAEIARIEKEITLRQKALSALKTEASVFKKYQTCYESYMIYRNTLEELQSLPEKQEYPPDGLMRLERMEDKQRELREKISAIENGNRDEEGIKELTEKCNASTFNSKLLEQEEAIEYIRKNLEKYKQTLNDKTTDQEKLQQINHSIMQNINKINAQWSEQNIIDFKELIGHRSKLETFRTRFDALKEKRHELEVRRRVSSDKTLSINTEAVIIAVSVFFMIVSIPALLSSYYVWAIASLLVAILLFGCRKYLLAKSAPIDIKSQSEAIRQEEQELQDLYQTYLKGQLQLPISLAPAAALEALMEIERLKEAIDDRDEIYEKQIRQRIPFIEKFEKGIKSLVSELQTEDENNPPEIMASRLVSEYDQSKAEAQEKKRLSEACRRRNRELENCKNDLRLLEKENFDLLKSINASDSNDFRIKYAVNTRVTELLQKKNNSLQTIETVIGLNSSKKIIDFFSTHNKEEINARIVHLDTMLSQEEDAFREYTLNLGEKKNELRRLESTANLAEIMTELGMQQAKLRIAYKEWLTGKIALGILSEVKNNYEKKRQPVVIKNSSAYFSTITGGKYQRIHVSLNNQEITIFDARESARGLERLSRGTKEQLLISLRLGLIEAYEKQAESLPVVADEALVNFDPQRAKRTAEILLKFAEERQVLLFTCHPVTKEYFKPFSFNLIQI